MTPAMPCLRCGQLCEMADPVYILVTARVNDPTAFLGVTEIGCSGTNGVVHQRCLAGLLISDEIIAALSTVEPAAVTGPVERSSVLEGFDLE